MNDEITALPSGQCPGNRSTLVTLYPELLSQVTRLLSAFDQHRMWLCGSKCLQSTISRGGVDTWDFRVSKRMSLCLWPKCLNTLTTLRNAYLRIPAELFTGLQSEAIAGLPRTLRCLDLKTSSSSGVPMTLDFTDFSILDTLKVERFILEPSVVQRLPGTLRVLHTMTTMALVNSTTLPLLRLEELSLTFLGRLFPAFFNLSHLEDLISLSLFSVLASWGNLPSTLESLSYDGIIELSTLERLPVGLTALNALWNDPATTLAARLPRSIRSLKLTLGNSMHTLVGQEFLLALPSRLQHLELENGEVEASSSPYLPSSLTELRARFSSSPKDKDPRIRLPPYLRIFIQRGVAIPIAPPYPPSLRVLECPVINLNSAEQLEWPLMLQTLTTSVSESRDMRGPPPGGRFQLTIEDLLERYYADPEGNLRIPSSITQLDVAFLRGSLLTAVIPPALVSLRLRNQASWLSSTFLPRWSLVLPPTITSLDVENVEIDEEWMDHLNLPLLRLFRCSSLAVPGRRIADFPESIEVLDVLKFLQIDWNVDLRGYRRLRSLRIASPQCPQPATGFTSLLPKSISYISFSPTTPLLPDLSLELRLARVEFSDSRLGVPLPQLM